MVFLGRGGPALPSRNTAGRASPQQARLETLFSGAAQVLGIGVAVLFGVFTVLAFYAAEQALAQATMANQLGVLSLCAAGGEGGSGSSAQANVVPEGAPPPGPAVQLADSDLCNYLLSAAAKKDLNSMANELFAPPPSSASASSSAPPSTITPSSTVVTYTDSTFLLLTMFNGTGLNGTLFVSTYSTSFSTYTVTETVNTGAVAPAAPSSYPAAATSQVSEVSDGQPQSTTVAVGAPPPYPTTSTPPSQPSALQGNSGAATPPSSTSLPLALGVGLGVGIPAAVAAILSVWLTILKWRNQHAKASPVMEYRPLLGA